MRSIYFRLTLFVLVLSLALPLRVFSEGSNVESVSFWLRQLPNADEVAIQPSQLQAFNQKIREAVPEVVNLFEIKTLPSHQKLTDEFSKTLTRFQERTYYDPSGKMRPIIFYEKLKQELNFNPPPYQMTWALTVRRTSLRELPTLETLLEAPDDLAFDQLQDSTLEVGEPLLVLCTSRSRLWFYVQARSYRGWILATDVAQTSHLEVVRNYAQSRAFGVVLAPNISVFGDVRFQTISLEMGMGTRLSDLVRTKEAWEIRIPYRTPSGRLQFETGFIPLQNDITANYLTLTSANVLKQAFKLLGMPYGWGGSLQGDDCSGFLVKVFHCFGIEMPRNSSQQAKIGHVWSEFKPKTKIELKKAVLARAPDALTFLVLHGHIMLYLGRVENQDFAIHNTWSLREHHLLGDSKLPVGRVVVSSLETGKGTQKGSYLDRIVTINSISL